MQAKETANHSFRLVDRASWTFLAAPFAQAVIDEEGVMEPDVVEARWWSWC